MSTSKDGGSRHDDRNDASYYLGVSGDADFAFPRAVWQPAQTDLLKVEPTIRQLAAEFDLEYLSNTEGKIPWPSRGN